MKHNDGLDAWLTALRHEMARACELPEKVKMYSAGGWKKMYCPGKFLWMTF